MNGFVKRKFKAMKGFAKFYMGVTYIFRQFFLKAAEILEVHGFTDSKTKTRWAI